MRELTYENFVWTFNALKKNGLDVMKYFVETKYFFDLRFNHEGVEYKCIVYKTSIPVIISREDLQNRNNVENSPEVKIIGYTEKDVEWFKREELFDYMHCLSF